ncbi:hypothetical protein EK21DRAFT_112966 [Setomelanomma holmii]|uniref:Uncharacterized protein n=1 Tax=Setomelanomma holmii TaxID=210430 RepID=A0A9P4H726_9PLEO|nr:hypothetical protein EK21DRAFT_112966 [Setomelanomma holmii]
MPVQHETIAVRIRDAVRTQDQEQDITVRAVFDERYMGVHISENLARALRQSLADGTKEGLWLEEGRSESRRDRLQVQHGLGVDMVLGCDIGQHIEEGRSSVVAPLFPKRNKGK